LPSGDGQQLALQIQMNGIGFQNYRISFTEPWLGGKKPTSLGVSAYYSIQRSFVTDYRLSIIGSSVDLGHRLEWPDDWFRTFSTLNYRFYDVTAGGSIFGEFDSGQIHILSFRQSLERNSINAPIYPTGGSRLMASVELTPPWNALRPSSMRLSSEDDPADRFKLLEFHKWKFEFQTFARVYKNMVIMPRVMYGFLGSYDQGLGLSPFERFYLGGDGLFGFALDGREIVALRGYRFPSIGDGVNGNSVYNKFTLELRQPITLSPSATVWVHGFLEAGNAWRNLRDFNPFRMYTSAGAGVRIFLPIFGLLGVDYGYGFVRGAEAGGGGNFHFMIGQQF
jgi:outer membrane protein insertion porin family